MKDVGNFHASLHKHFLCLRADAKLLLGTVPQKWPMNVALGTRYKLFRIQTFLFNLPPQGNHLQTPSPVFSFKFVSTPKGSVLASMCFTSSHFDTQITVQRSSIIVQIKSVSASNLYYYFTSKHWKIYLAHNIHHSTFNIKKMSLQDLTTIYIQFSFLRLITSALAHSVGSRNLVFRD